jgi:oligosaccharide reducing-end xylanase
VDVHANDDDDGGTRDGKLAWSAQLDRSWTDPRIFHNARLIQCSM